MTSDFSEDDYLAAYPDVAHAVGIGQFESGRHHYETFGRKEGRLPKAHRSVLLGETCIVSKEDQLSRLVGSETLLATGSSRGGTSIIAYALLRMGYPLVADAGPNHEIRAMASDDLDVISGIIARENSRRRWGFKLPSAARNITWYVDHLRNPVILMIYRNPVAIARSILNRTEWGQTEISLERALRHGLSYMQEGSSCLGSAAPAILLDLDAGMRSPASMLEELRKLFALDVPQGLINDIAAEISIPGYKNI